MESNDISRKIYFNIARDFLRRMGLLVEISDEIQSSLMDKMFNIKLSMSILRGGIVDFQRGKVGSDIYTELKKVKENLTGSLIYLKSIKKKLEILGNLEEDSILQTDISQKHIKKIHDFFSDISKFIKKIKVEVIDKLYDLLDIILYEEDIKHINQENVEKWFSSCLILLNKGLSMIKLIRHDTNNVKKENLQYLSSLEKAEKEEIIVGNIYKTDNTSFREPPKWFSHVEGEKLYFIKNNYDEKN